MGPGIRAGAITHGSGGDLSDLPIDEGHLARPAARAQGREHDTDVRRAIEQHAEDHAAAYFERQEWQVKRVGQYKLGYDLVCTKPSGATLHVEVKGTRTLGEKVTLTANEVEHTRHATDCGAEHILYVLSQITVTDSGTINCSGGTPTRLWPWTISTHDLIATEYAYTIPPVSNNPQS